MFQASTNVITLYLKMPRIQQLLDLTKKFWEVDYSSNDKDLIVIKNRITYFKWFFCYYIFVGSSTVAVGYIYKPYFTNNRVLIYEGNVPEDNIIYYVLLIVETYSIWLTGVACTAFDLFLATILTFTSIQFRLLGLEFRSLIGQQAKTKEHKVEIRKNIKRCIDHHNFLLE